MATNPEAAAKLRQAAALVADVVEQLNVPGVVCDTCGGVAHADRSVLDHYHRLRESPGKFRRIADELDGAPPPERPRRRQSRT
jgi:hypothetical protein